MRAQVPRAATTMAPLTWEVAVSMSPYSDSRHPSEMLPSVFFSTVTGCDPVGSGGAEDDWLDHWTVIGPPGVSVMTAPGQLWCESMAATVMVFAPVEGDPTMYGTLPELPAEATTMVPACSALVEATASA